MDCLGLFEISHLGVTTYKGLRCSDDLLPLLSTLQLTLVASVLSQESAFAEVDTLETFAQKQVS